MGVCTRTGHWAAKRGSVVAQRTRGYEQGRACFPPQPLCPVGRDAPLHRSRRCPHPAVLQLGPVHSSTVPNIPVCVGGSRQRRWDSGAARAWIPLGKPHLLEAPSKGFSLSLRLTSCILLLLLASLARSSHLFPTQPENTFQTNLFSDVYTFSNTFFSRDADLWCVKAH